MSLEAPQSNQQNPEGISPQQQERFLKLQTEIVGRIPPNRAMIIFSSNEVDPQARSYIQVNSESGWDLLFGGIGYHRINDSGKPVDLLKLLKDYAFAVSACAALLHTDDEKELEDQARQIRISFDKNPYPFADRLLEDMERSLKEKRETVSSTQFFKQMFSI